MAESREFVAYRNEELFKDNYLKNRLPDSEELWGAAGLRKCQQQIAELYEREGPQLPGYNEPQLEEHFIRPVLSLLGHCYEVQERLVDQPDYAFFPDEDTRQAAHSKPEGKFWEDAIGLGDAKSWDTDLDTKGKGSPFGQIKRYLYEYGKDWGILTNGQLWRLYHRERSRLKPIFYEVDLPRLLEERNEEGFKYFYLFFRRQALYDPPRRPFLDVVSEESTRYAEQLQKDLRAQVYQALRYACQGFLSYKPNGLTAADFNEIHDNALVLLYRLLFILYAEARGLLPMDNAQYRETYSLNAIKRQATGQLAATVTTYWPNVHSLCQAIDSGNEELGIPEYNGGLFDPQRHQFLEHKELPDKYLAQVLDALARTAEGQFLDYSDLEVRHLGSIYEGLLEYNLAQATEPMVAVKRKGKEKWLPQTQASSSAILDRCQLGELYLATDRGERKATGSYYTPQYIVKYIVDNTVGPLVEKCDSAEDILQLNILDPAMGSGHFLVEATDYLARAIAEKQGENWEELTEEERTPFKRQVVERCIYGVDLNPLAVELAKLSLWLHTAARGKALNFLDHHLRCGDSLIGAKIEELAAPPQIRQRRKKKEEAGQVAVFDYNQFTRHANRMVQDFALLQDKPSETRVDVQHKGEILQQLDKAHRRPYREIADLWCSRYFGNDYDGLRYNQVMGYLQRDPDSDLSQLSPEAQEVLTKSRQIAEQRRFFHWEIEFPEVFFDEFGRRQQNPGFDAVIGNPPYVRVDAIDVRHKPFYRFCYRTARGKYDLYYLMTEQSIKLLSSRGWFAFIIPNRWTGNDTGLPVRCMLAGAGLHIEVVSLLDVFPDSAVYPVVAVYAGSGPKRVSVGRPAAVKGLGSAPAWELGVDSWKELPASVIPIMADQQTIAVALKCIEVSQPVGEHFRISEGLRFPRGDIRDRVDEVTTIGVIMQYQFARYTDIRPLAELTTPAADALDWSTPRLRATRRDKIVFAEDALRFKGTVDLTAGVPQGGVYFAVPRRESEWEPFAALAVLNSTLLAYLFESLWGGIHMGSGYLRFRTENVRLLPLRVIDRQHVAGNRSLLEECDVAVQKGDYQRPLELATQALATHAALYGPGGKPELCDDPYWEAAIAQADKTFPGREDFVHDLLAALAQRMIDLNKEKHAEIDGFLRWLETEIGTPIDELSGKTIIKGYYEQPDGYDELLSRLKKNRKHLGDLPHKRAFQERLRQEYEKSMQQLTPVIEALVKTDHLIDQIVYALYGLTEEEIAIVEESRA